MKNHVMFVVLAFTLLAAAVRAQEAEPGLETTGGDQLVKEKGRFEETWVRPDADFSRYDRIDPRVAELDFRQVDSRPADNAGMVNTFALSADEQEKFRQVVTRALVDELARSKKLELVDDVRPGSLIVRASVLDIVCRVPPPTAQDVRVYLSTIGEATMRFELIDAESGVIQARLEERSKILPSGRAGYEVSPVPVYRLTMWRDVDRWSRDGASDLRRVLDKAASSGRVSR